MGAPNGPISTIWDANTGVALFLLTKGNSRQEWYAGLKKDRSHACSLAKRKQSTKVARIHEPVHFQRFPRGSRSFCCLVRKWREGGGGSMKSQGPFLFQKVLGGPFSKKRKTVTVALTPASWHFFFSSPTLRVASTPDSLKDLG